MCSDILILLNGIFLFSSFRPQSDKKEFVKEAKERNKTILRRRKEPSASSEKVGTTSKNKTIANNSLPKLKSLLPSSKQRESKPFNRPVQENKPRIRQPKKYAHIRSSGYGGVNPLPNITKDGKTTDKTTLPSLRKPKPKPNKLPVLGEPRRRR